MNWTEVLFKDDAQALILLLAESCGVKPPRISFGGRKQRRGFYTPKKKTITLAKWTQTWIVAHEFAHYLDHVETGRNIAAQANDHEWHSQGFYYKLRKVARLLGGEYPWQKEYKQLARWAKNDGLLRVAPETKEKA